jgi:hypothetical protein
MALVPYQDWSRYRTPGGDYIDQNVTNAVPDFLGSIVDASAWNYVNIVVNNQDPGVVLKVVVHWRAYAGTLTSLMNPYFIVGGFQTASIVLPVRGRTVQMEISVLSGSASNGATYWIVGTSHKMTQYDVKIHNQPYFSGISSYGSNTNATIAALDWYEGPMQVAAFSDAGNTAWVEWQMLSNDGVTWTDFAITQVLSRQNSNPRLIYWPASPVQALVFNTGAAQSIGLWATPASAAGGGG